MRCATSSKTTVLFEEGAATYQLADLLWEDGDRDGALQELKALCRSTHRMRAHTILAERLAENGEPGRSPPHHRARARQL